MIPLFLFGQSRIGEWRSYTSTLDVRKAVELNDQIVCATSGGILIFDRENSTYQTVTNIDGLAEIDLSALAVDHQGHLWVGSSSPRGIVQIYDPEKRRAVKTFDLGLTKIADIVPADSIVFVAYSKNFDWGILEFIWNDDEYIFKEIFTPSDERLDYISNLAVSGDSLFAGTSLGLLVGDFRQHILKYPQNWTMVQDFDGQSVTRITPVGNEFLIIANGFVWSYLDSLSLLSSAYGGESSLIDVARASDNALYGITRNRLIRFTEGGSVDSLWAIGAKAQSLLALSDDNFLLTTLFGLAIWDSDTGKFRQFVPNSPVSNVYTALTVLDDGRLVAAGEKGISILSNEGWYNLVPSADTSIFHNWTGEDFDWFVADTAQYKTNRIWSVVKRRDGRAFFSIQGVYADVRKSGGGVVSFDLNNPSDFVVYDTTYINTFDDKGYQNVRGLTLDENDNLWISNFGARDLDRKITIFTADGRWVDIPQSGENSISHKLENPTEILIMDRGLVMVGSSIEEGIFLISFDPSDLDPSTSVPSDSTGVLKATWTNFSENDGLESNTVWSLAPAEPSVVWSLSSEGLQRLSFNSTYTRMTPYAYTYFPNVPFGEGSKLVIDRRNNLWLSSITSGLYVLLENSTPWPDWQGFRHNNSYLLSDAVTAVAFDDERGMAYIATSKGINSLRTPFAEEKKSYHSVMTYPSPYRIPNDQPMVIDGLMDNSTVKIITLSGRVLRQIEPTSPSVRGYQAFWDGKTDRGEFVGTGVYLLAVYAKTGESHTTKIAVIRE